MVRPRSCRVIYYFDTPALGRRHQSFGRVKGESTQTYLKMFNKEMLKMKELLKLISLEALIRGVRKHAHGEDFIPY